MNHKGSTGHFLSQRIDRFQWKNTEETRGRTHANTTESSQTTVSMKRTIRHCGSQISRCTILTLAKQHFARGRVNRARMQHRAIRNDMRSDVTEINKIMSACNFSVPELEPFEVVI